MSQFDIKIISLATANVFPARDFLDLQDYAVWSKFDCFDILRDSLSSFARLKNGSDSRNWRGTPTIE